MKAIIRSTMTLTIRNIAEMISTVPMMAFEVLPEDHRDAVARQAGPGEHRLDQEGVAEHRREIEADDGERRDQRRPEGIAVGDPLLGKP